MFDLNRRHHLLCGRFFHAAALAAAHHVVIISAVTRIAAELLAVARHMLRVMLTDVVLLVRVVVGDALLAHCGRHIRHSRLRAIHAHASRTARAALRTRLGWELELRTINFAGNNFNWTSVLNMTHNKNKIVSLDGKLEQSIEGSWFIHKVGLPYSTFYVKEYAGVDPQTGKALYYMNTQDANGNYDKTVTTDASAAQAIPYKSVDPKISGGFTNIVNYKWFDLALTLTYSLGGYSFDKTGTYNETDGAKEQNYNLPIYELDRWQKPGDVTDVPRFVLGQAAGPQNSSRYVHSTDHLRVKNLTLGFTLPDQWLTKLGVSKARLYFSGSNLLTWAKWNQYDPEVPVSGEVFCETPPMRTYSFGIEVSF